MTLPIFSETTTPKNIVRFCALQFVAQQNGHTVNIHWWSQEEVDARPTARGVLGMLRQVKLDKTANVQGT